MARRGGPPGRGRSAAGPGPLPGATGPVGDRAGRLGRGRAAGGSRPSASRAIRARSLPQCRARAGDLRLGRGPSGPCRRCAPRVAAIYPSASCESWTSHPGTRPRSESCSRKQPCALTIPIPLDNDSPRSLRYSRLIPGAPVLDAWLRRARSSVDASTAAANGDAGLTPAELRTLQYLPTHYSFREIGEQLVVSVNTVRSQAQAVYRKLGASTRREAVECARERGLIETRSEPPSADSPGRLAAARAVKGVRNERHGPKGLAGRRASWRSGGQRRSAGAPDDSGRGHDDVDSDSDDAEEEPSSSDEEQHRWRRFIGFALAFAGHRRAGRARTGDARLHSGAESEQEEPGHAHRAHRGDSSPAGVTPGVSPTRECAETCRALE